jgi:Flp pilus assembly protein CpaB
MTSIFKGSAPVWILAIVFAFVAAFGTLVLLGQAAERVPYYVVNTDVAERTQITADNTDEFTAPRDSVPPTALTVDQIESGDYFARIAMVAGTPITAAVVTEGLSSLQLELPEGFRMASLTVSPENAAGGRIAKGDYVDVVAVSGSDTDAVGRIVLQHVLVLDVAVTPPSIADSAAGDANPEEVPGPDSSALYGGIPEMYTFAVTPQDAVKLALVRDAAVYLLLSNEQEAPEGLDVTVNGSDLFVPGAVGPSGSGGISTDEGVTGISTQPGTTEARVEAFLADWGSGEATLTVEGDLLVARDANGEELANVPLNGGSFDLSTQTYTPAG